MKKRILNPAFPFVLALLTLGLFITACKDDDTEDVVESKEIKFQNATLTGPKEVPTNNSTATGTFAGVFNKETKMITYTITWTGLMPTNMHFHTGKPNANFPAGTPATGVSGPVTIGIPSPYVSPYTGTTRALTEAEETDLLAGNWYVNVHSSTYPGGEIRGQVVQ